MALHNNKSDSSDEKRSTGSLSDVKSLNNKLLLTQIPLTTGFSIIHSLVERVYRES